MFLWTIGRGFVRSMRLALIVLLSLFALGIIGTMLEAVIALSR